MISRFYVPGLEVTYLVSHQLHIGPFNSKQRLQSPVSIQVKKFSFHKQPIFDKF